MVSNLKTKLPFYGVALMATLFLSLAFFRQTTTLVEWDYAAYNLAIQTSVVDWSLSIWRIITILGDGIFVYACFALLIVFSWLRKNKIIPFRFVFFLAGIFLINPMLKILFAASRPVTIDKFIKEPTSYAFPSGHSANAVFLFFLLPILMKIIFPDNLNLKQKTQWLLSFIGITLIGLSRIFLGVHWLTDVLGGFLVGGFGTFLTVLAMRKL